MFISEYAARVWATAQPFYTPGADGALGTINNRSIFAMALSALDQVAPGVTYFKGRDGVLYSPTDLVRPGVERVAGNERYWPRYLDTGDAADVNIPVGTVLQSEFGSSIVIPGVIVPATHPQPKVEPTNAVTGELPAFTDIIGGPGEPAGETTTPASLAESPASSFRLIPEAQPARTIEIPATLRAISKAGALVKTATGELRIAPIVIPSVDPISIVINIGLVLGSLFRGLFGGGDKELKRSVEKLRDAFVEGTKKQTQFTWKTSFGLGWLLIAVGKLWVRVVRPLLDAVARIIGELHRLYEKVLKPIFATIEKIRRHILQIYEKFVRPVIVAIQRVRRVLYILRIFHVKWAEKLDARLARLESQIARPFLELLRMVNTLGGWMNVILTGRLIFQEPLFVNSMIAYARDMIQLFHVGKSKPLSAADRAKLHTEVQPMTLTEARAAARLALESGAGRWGEQLRRAQTEARGKLGL